MSMHVFLQQLKGALGEEVVEVDQDAIAPWLSDWRNRYAGQAQALVRPVSTEQVAECLRLCNEHKVQVVPRGGNTGLCGGATPDSSARNIIVSLDRMRRIRLMDPISNTMIVDAGCVLGDLRRAANDVERLLPLSLAAEDSSQIGGNVATNAGGVNVVRYGMVRNLVLGIEAVLPNGAIFNGLQALRKDNTGFDLKQLFIGSEGTLGIITGVALQLHALTPIRSVVLVAVQSVQHALDLLRLVFGFCGPRLQAFEFFTDECLGLVLTHSEQLKAPFLQRYPAYVLIELADTVDEENLEGLLEEVIGNAVQQGLCEDAIVSRSLSQLQSLWNTREHISEAQAADGLHLKHDIAVPIETIPDFMRSVEQQLREVVPDARIFVFGHLGDGNLHYNVSRPLNAPNSWAIQNEEKVAKIVFDEVMSYGGSISAEHGIGQLKRDVFLATKDPLQIQLMQQVKMIFDPNHIMNPGKLLCSITEGN